MPYQLPDDIKPLHVFSVMASDGNIIVTDKKLHIQIPGNGKSCGLGIVPLLLGTVTSKNHDDTIGICHRNSVHMIPQVSQAA